MWKGGNLIEVERVKMPSYELPKSEDDEEKPKRGKVTENTKGAMRRMRKDMAKVHAKQKAFTSCLTYPQELIELCPDAAGAKKDWQALQRWIDNKFPWFGGYWKREPHKSGITHFHLLYFLNGSSEELVRETMQQILFEWCCITTGKGSAFPDVEHQKQLKWHLDERNFEKVKEGMSFFNYLGKYLSKNSNEIPDGYNNENGGNWWGKFNKRAIPYVEALENTKKLQDKLEKDAMRMMYRTRLKRKQAGFDSLHHTSPNPRQDRDSLARALWKSTPKKERRLMRFYEKIATRIIFRTNGSRKSLTAPIKANSSWCFGTCSLMGDPAPILEHLKQLCSTSARDPVARARIFSDSYQPPQATKKNE